MGHLDDIQTALKPLIKWKKLKNICVTILELSESFKTMNRPGPNLTLFDSLFIGKCKRYELKILTQSPLRSSIISIKIENRYLI